MSFAVGLSAPGLSQELATEEGETLYYAERLFNDGLYDLAALQYQRFVDSYPLSPKAPEAAFRIGECLVKMADYDRARLRFQEFNLLFPESAWLDRAQFQIGNCFENLKQYRKAAESFRRVIIFRPKSDLAPDALVAAGRNFLLENDFSASAEALFALLEKYPTSPRRFDARLLLAKGYVAQDNLDQALAELDKFSGEKIPDALSAEAEFTRAQVFEKRIRFTRAEEIYTRLLASNLKNDYITQAAIRLAQLRKLRGDYPGAIAALKVVLPELPATRQTEVQLLLADCYFLSDSFAEALPIYRNIPHASDGWRDYRLARTFASLGQIDSALVVLAPLANLPDSVLKQEPDRILILANLYLTLLKNTGHSQEAVGFGRAFTARLGFRDGVDRIYFQTAQIMQEDLQNPRAALRLFRIVSEQFPNSAVAAESQFEAARILFRLGDYSSAQSEFEQYLTFFPGARDHARAQSVARFFQAVLPTKTTATEPGTVLPGVQGMQFTSDPRALNLANIQFFLVHNYGMALWYYKKALAEADSESNRDQILFRLMQCYDFLALDASFSGQTKLSTAYTDSLITTATLLIRHHPESGLARQARNQVLQIVLQSDTSAFDAVELESLRNQMFSPADSLAPEQALFAMLQADMIASLSDSSNLQQAIQTYQQTRSRLAEPWMQAMAQTKLIRSYAKMRQYPAALSEARDFVQKFPQDPNISRAYFELARLEFQAGEGESALNRCLMIRQKYYYSAYADSASRLQVEILRQGGETDQALEALQQWYERRSRFLGPLALENEQNQAELYWQFVRTYQAAGDQQRVVAYSVRYLKNCPNCARAPSALYILGENALASRKLDDARDFFLNLETHFPQDTLAGLASLRLGDVEFSKGAYEDARKKYLSVPTTLALPHRKSARFQAILALIRMSRVEAAESEIEVFNKEFGDAEAYALLCFELGDQHLTLKNFPSAEKIFKQITRLQKETQAAGKGELGLGKLYLITNKTDQALETLSRIPEKYTDPEIVALALINLGDFYLQNRQIQNALVVFKKAEQLKIKPENQATVARFLIRCYNDLGLWDQAIALTRDFIARYPDAEDVFDKKVNIGILLLRVNEYERAISYFRDLKRFASRETEPEIQYHIGEAYLSMGRFEEAISEFLKVKYLSLPTKLAWDVTAFYQAGMLYLKLERYDRARQIFQQLVREQGAASDFGRVAVQKIEQIDKLLGPKGGGKG